MGDNNQQSFSTASEESNAEGAKHLTKLLPYEVRIFLGAFVCWSVPVACMQVGLVGLRHELGEGQLFDWLRSVVNMLAVASFLVRLVLKEVTMVLGKLLRIIQEIRDCLRSQYSKQPQAEGIGGRTETGSTRLAIDKEQSGVASFRLQVLAAFLTLFVSTVVAAILISLLRKFGLGEARSSELAFVVVAVVFIPLHFAWIAPKIEASIPSAKPVWRVADLVEEAVPEFQDKVQQLPPGKFRVTRPRARWLITALVILIAVLFLIFFTIPSIPVWRAALHLDSLHADHEKKKQTLVLARAELEKLETPITMGGDETEAQMALRAEIKKKESEVNQLQGVEARTGALYERARAKVGAGGPWTLWGWLVNYLGVLADFLGVALLLKVFLGWIGGTHRICARISEG